VGNHLLRASPSADTHSERRPLRAHYDSRFAIVACLATLSILDIVFLPSQIQTGGFKHHFSCWIGAVKPRAQANLLDAQTSLSRNTGTNDEGSYKFLLIPLGACMTPIGFEVAAYKTVTVSFYSPLLVFPPGYLLAMHKSSPAPDLPSTEKARLYPLLHPV
jgi:hypothetical protein